MRNKFVFAQDLIRDFDIFLISESKLDDTFPNNQFKIDHYKMFRLDRNRYGIKSVYYRIFDDYKVNANETWIISLGMDLFYGRARPF